MVDESVVLNKEKGPVFQDLEGEYESDGQDLEDGMQGPAVLHRLPQPLLLLWEWVGMVLEGVVGGRGMGLTGQLLGEYCRRCDKAVVEWDKRLFRV